MEHFIEKIERLGQVSSFSQLTDWFMSLSLWVQILLGLGAFGILIVIIFFIRMAFENYN